MGQPKRYYIIDGDLVEDANGNLCHWQDYNDACEDYLALREEVREADRKAGEARRHWEYMRDRQHAHDDWLRKAKEQWGVHENTSFDVVWNECLQLKADNEALRARLNILEAR